jgi:hypothetical protein
MSRKWIALPAALHSQASGVVRQQVLSRAPDQAERLELLALRLSRSQAMS